MPIDTKFLYAADTVEHFIKSTFYPSMNKILIIKELCINVDITVMTRIQFLLKFLDAQASHDLMIVPD